MGNKENNNKSNRWPSWQLFDKDSTADRTLICSPTMRKLFACFILSALGNDGLQNDELNEVKVLQEIFDIHIDIQCLLYILLIIHICTPTEIDATLICNFPFATTVYISHEI